MEPRLPSRPGCLCSAPMPPAAPSRDIVVVHSSDLHIDHDYTARLHGGDGTAGLSGVLSAARTAGADAVVLAGDTFDCHRVPIDLLERAAAVISAAALPVVLLPGNHDPVVPDAVYHNGALAAVENLHVLGVTHEEAVVFADLGLEIWGRPHRDYGDMIPFERLRPRSTRWQIAVAHGHYVPVPDRTHRLRPSWLIGIRRHRQRGAADRDRRGRGHARRARHCARALGRRLALKRAWRSEELEVRMGCRIVSLPLAFAVALTVAALGTAARSQAPSGTWTQKAPMPAVRGEVAAAAVGDKLFALGGGVAGKAVPRNEEYDPATDRWQARAPLPQPRDHLGVAVHDGKIYTFGGFTSSVHQGAGDVVFEYDPASDRWRTLAPMKAPRAAVGVAVLAGKIHVIGGRRLDAVTVATHEVYDPATGTWSEAAPLPKARDHMAVVALAGKIQVIGGRLAGPVERTGQHDVYDPATNSWTSAAPLPTPRSGVAAALYKGMILVLGGACTHAGRTAWLRRRRDRIECLFRRRLVDAGRRRDNGSVDHVQPAVSGERRELRDETREP